MQFICPFTGISYTLQTSADFPHKYIALHPICTMHQDQVIQLPSCLLKTLGLLHILHKRELVSYVPHKAFAITPDASSEACIHKINTLLLACIRKPASSLKECPRYRLHNTKLHEILAYVTSLHDALHTVHVEAAQEFLEETRSQRVARVSQKNQLTRTIQKTAQWANEQLVMRASGYNIHRSAHLFAALEGKRPIAIIRMVRESLLEALPETKLEDAIRKETLIQALDEQVATIIKSFGSLDMLSAEERETTNKMLARYTATSEVPASIQALAAMAVTPAVLKEPVREEYTSPLSYALALAAYKTRTTGE